jgi:hypothetical protein
LLGTLISSALWRGERERSSTDRAAHHTVEIDRLIEVVDQTDSGPARCVQILTDMATRLGLAPGWEPAATG